MMDLDKKRNETCNKLLDAIDWHVQESKKPIMKPDWVRVHSIAAQRLAEAFVSLCDKKVVD
jgi:hypothetical protein